MRFAYFKALFYLLAVMHKKEKLLWQILHKRMQEWQK